MAVRQTRDGPASENTKRTRCGPSGSTTMCLSCLASSKTLPAAGGLGDTLISGIPRPESWLMSPQRTEVSMSISPRSTVSARGVARVRQRPSFLVMIGRIDASAATLELALKNLRQKRVAVSQWLDRLEAQSPEFGEPRFADQTEPDPVTMAHKMARRRLRQGRPATSQKNNGKKTVVVSYSARWPIDTKSSDEVLIFVDRLQFEAADLPEAEAESPKASEQAWESDPVEHMQSLLSDMTRETEGDETHFLFLSRISADQYEEALARAFKDAQSKAAIVARAAGAELDELVTAHYSPAETDGVNHMQEIHRRTSMPLLNETPLGMSKDDCISESPRMIEFVISMHVTYGIKP